MIVCELLSLQLQSDLTPEMTTIQGDDPLIQVCIGSDVRQQNLSTVHTVWAITTYSESH